MSWGTGVGKVSGNALVPSRVTGQHFMPKKNDTIIETEVPNEDSYDALQKQIDELRKKQAVALAIEEGEAVEEVEFPLADIMLAINKQTILPKLGVTPPEVALLAAMHHIHVGGNPIRDIKPLGKSIRIDPIELKRRLMLAYSVKKVDTLFPGPVPNFPTKFIRAIRMGTDVKMTPEHLFDFHVTAGSSGEGQ